MLRIAGLAFVLGCAVSMPVGAMDDNIESAFGFRLGQVFTPENVLRPPVVAGDVITYSVPAAKSFRTMKVCRVSVTPKSGRVVSITAESQPFETLGEAQREGMLLVSILKDKYLPKLEESPPPPPVAQPSPSTKATSQIKAATAPSAVAKNPAPATTPQPKSVTSFKARRGSVEAPFATDAIFRQGNRSISTELISVVGTIDETPAKPTVQITYADQEMAQAAAKERQELDIQRARLWIEEQAQHTDGSAL